MYRLVPNRNYYVTDLMVFRSIDTNQGEWGKDEKELEILASSIESQFTVNMDWTSPGPSFPSTHRCKVSSFKVRGRRLWHRDRKKVTNYEDERSGDPLPVGMTWLYGMGSHSK